MRYAKGFKLVLASVIGFTTAMTLLMVATVQIATQEAQATAALAKGKPCSACHSSGKPSKSDLKKK